MSGQSDTTVCKTVSASPLTRAVIGSPPGTTKGRLPGSGGMAGVTEAAEINFVAVLGGLPPGEQRPVRTRRDSLEGKALTFGQAQQPFPRCQLRAISNRAHCRTTRTQCGRVLTIRLSSPRRTPSGGTA